jgi:SAM-dependent methyltransferase
MSRSQGRNQGPKQVSKQVSKQGKKQNHIRTGPNRVEVKHGRKGRALHINGTFASWYDPASAITGSVWDALAAPLLLLPRQCRKRVLILGLGGGSAARIVRALAPKAQITGVELDKEVVKAAKRWFDLDRLGVDVVCDDALRYLARSRRQFDVIFEDIFVGSGRRVHKPDWLPVPGHTLAARRLGPRGVLVSNTIDETAVVSREMRRTFPSTLRISVADYDNQIIVGARFPLSGRLLRSAVTASSVLASTAPRLSFRLDRSSRISAAGAGSGRRGTAALEPGADVRCQTG